MFNSLPRCALRIINPRRISEFQQTRYLKHPDKNGKRGIRQSQNQERKQDRFTAHKLQSENGGSSSNRSKYLSKYYGIQTENTTQFEEYLSKYQTRKGVKTGKLIEGHVRIARKNSNIVFVTPTDGSPDVFIEHSRINKNRALNGDLVAVQIVSDPNQAKDAHSTNNKEEVNEKDLLLDKIIGEKESGFKPKRQSRIGKVVSIIKKIHPRLSTGYVDLDSVKNYPTGEIRFIPLDTAVPELTISAADLPKEIFQNPDAYSKTLFVAKIVNWRADASEAEGKLVKSIGNMGDINAEMEGYLIENQVDAGEFSQQVLDCLPTEAKWRIPTSELECRKDLRKYCIFTIDPVTARDIDDALSCEDLGNGLYKVGVHIADVSYFVKPETALDDVASKRTTSYYLVQKAIPMLPKLLSEELCSLNPNVDRLAFSVEWIINDEGEVVSEWYGRTIIKSCVKLSYDHAQGFINDPDKQWTVTELPPISKPFRPKDIGDRIHNLQKLAVQIRKKRQEQGYLGFGNEKLDFMLDPDTNLPNACFVYEIKDSNKLIEEFMLLANRTVARIIKQKFPQKAVLRYHEPPEQSMLKELKETCKKFGIDMDISSAGSIQKSLDQLHDSDETSKYRRHALDVLIKRTLTLAQYACAGTRSDDSKLFHYALNMPLYTHFTSPIRRYPDILVHRLLGAVLGYNSVTKKSIQETQKVLTHANDRRMVSKKVSDKSSDLFFAAFLKTVGPIEEKAMVMGIKRNLIEVFVPRFGVSKRVELKKLPSSHTMMNEHTILIHWHKGEQKRRYQSITQKIELFSEIDCILEVPKDEQGLNWQATIVSPPDNKPSGGDSDQTVQNEISSMESSKKGTIESSKKGTIESSKIGTIESSKKGTIESSKKDTIGSSKGDTIESSKKDNIESSKKDTIESSKKGTIESSKRDTIESSKGDTIESSKKDNIESSKKDTIESSKKGTIESSKRDTIGSSKKDTIESSKKDTFESSKKGTIESSKKDTIESSKKDTIESSKKDTFESSKKGTIESSKKGTIESSKKSIFSKFNFDIFKDSFIKSGKNKDR